MRNFHYNLLSDSQLRRSKGVMWGFALLTLSKEEEGGRKCHFCERKVLERAFL